MVFVLLYVLLTAFTLTALVINIYSLTLCISRKDTITVLLMMVFIIFANIINILFLIKYIILL